MALTEIVLLKSPINAGLLCSVVPQPGGDSSSNFPGGPVPPLCHLPSLCTEVTFLPVCAAPRTPPRSESTHSPFPLMAWPVVKVRCYKGALGEWPQGIP